MTEPVTSAPVTQRGNSPRVARTKQVFLLLVGATLIWSLYVVFANSFIPERLRAAAHQAGIDIEAASIRSVLPGRIRLAGLELSDRASGWTLKAKRADCHFDVWSLLTGSTKITRLTASGVDAQIQSASARANELAELSRRRAPTIHTGGLLLGVAPHAAQETPIVIESIRASGHNVRLGPHELVGDFEYTLDDVRLGAQGGSATLALSLVDVRLLASGQPATTLAGSVRAKVKPDGAQRSVWERASGKVDVSGALGSLRPWLSASHPAVRLRRARHDLSLKFEAGRILAGTIALNADLAEIEHADLGRTELTAPKLNVEVQESSALSLVARLAARSVKLIDSAGTEWAHLDSVRSVARLPNTEKEASKPYGRIEMNAERASLSTRHYTLKGSLQASARVQSFALEAGRLVFDNGELTAPQATLVSGDEYYPLDASLDIDSAQLAIVSGLDFGGSLSLKGEDAGMFLDMADADETVRWTLSLLEGQPFTLEADVDHDQPSLALSKVRFEAGSLSAQGAVLSVGQTLRGAFVVDALLLVGVELDERGIKSHAPVEASWLAEQQRVLSLPN